MQRCYAMPISASMDISEVHWLISEHYKTCWLESFQNTILVNVTTKSWKTSLFVSLNGISINNNRRVVFFEKEFVKWKIHQPPPHEIRIFLNFHINTPLSWFVMYVYIISMFGFMIRMWFSENNSYSFYIWNMILLFSTCFQACKISTIDIFINK